MEANDPGKCMEANLNILIIFEKHYAYDPST